MRILSPLLVITLLVSSVAAAADAVSQSFFGQTPPGREPVTFAAEAFVSECCLHGALNFDPDGKAIYWSLSKDMKSTICVSACDGGRFTKPDTASFVNKEGFAGAALAIDGKRMFFSGKLSRPGDESNAAWAIFCVEKTDSGWSSPRPIEATIDTLINKGQVTVARNGNIYFGGRVLAERTPAVFVCNYTDGKYSRPEKLTGAIATLPLAADPWVDPDERFMLVACPPLDGPPMLTDIGVSIRQSDGSWSLPVRIGGSVNTATGFERFPSLSPDGKYLFFIRCIGERFVGGDARYYWVSANILDSLVEKR